MYNWLFMGYLVIICSIRLSINVLNKSPNALNISDRQLIQGIFQIVYYRTQESNYTLFGHIFHSAFFPKKELDIKICISKMYSLKNYSFLYNVIISPLWKYKGLTSEVNPCSFRALISVRIKNP